MKSFSFISFLCFLAFTSHGLVAQTKKEPKTFLAKDSLEVIIQKAEQYISSNSSDMDYGSYAMLHYLMEDYQLSPIQHFDSYYNDLSKANDMYYFQRLVKNNIEVPSLNDFEKYKHGIDYYTLQALWSDQIEINKKAYYTSVLNLSQEGPYQLTHSLLALKWLSETNAVHIKKDKAYRQLKHQIEDKILKDLLGDVKFWGDVEIEAVALLIYSGDKNLVSPSWIQQIIAAQTDSGAWEDSSHSRSTSIHSTALSLWAILAYNDSKLTIPDWIQH